MTEAQLKQSDPADVRVQKIARNTNAVDEDRSRRRREATLRGEINRLLAGPVNTRRTPGIERERSQTELRSAIEANNDAILQERMRIAREMHDGLLQNVTGIALQLRAVLPRVRSAPEEAARVLERILELAERTSTEARLAVVGMRHITESDVVKAIQLTVEQALEESGLGLSIKIRGRTRTMSSKVCDTTTLIVRHAITNVLRHAQAHGVQLSVEFRIRSLRISIRDDGQGFVPHHGTTEATHFGLLGMRERARQIGAELRVRSSLGRGTTVSVIVPYPTNNSPNGEVAHSPKR
jgi:signal transduction histidine kinase